MGHDIDREKNMTDEKGRKDVNDKIHRGERVGVGRVEKKERCK